MQRYKQFSAAESKMCCEVHFAGARAPEGLLLKCLLKIQMEREQQIPVMQREN